MTAAKDLHLSRSVEDYLKTIYRLTEEGTTATTGRIAERLAVAPASVTGMVKKLEASEPPLVKRQARAGVHLTRDGEQAALRIVRRHRLLEQFLLEVLHYHWDEIHEEAERLEHVVSPQFVERLSLLLGGPSFDPHGAPIPDEDLNVPERQLAKLTDLTEGDSATVRRIRGDNPELLRYLADVGLQPGVDLEVQSANPVAGTIEVRLAGTNTTIGHNVGEAILVERKP
jgi:DtxR family Mn-dependent transcriptional regulator